MMKIIFNCLLVFILSACNVYAAGVCTAKVTIPCASYKEDVSVIESMIESKDGASLSAMRSNGRIVHIPQGEKVYREETSWTTSRVNYQGRSCWWYSEKFDCK